MKLFKYMKDGGKGSKVAGFFFVEIKSLFSVVLLHFSPGSREAYHSHAFNSLSWILRGKLVENMLNKHLNVYTRSTGPIVTTREDFHKVVSVGDTWVFSIRGPWSETWQEFLPNTNESITLTHGRKMVGQ